MAEEKYYRASTGVDEFYYAELDESDNVTGDIERVKFLQEITVEMPQEAVRAYGDNKTAEIAVASGDITVNSQFHTIPQEDKGRLLGLDNQDGIYAHGSSDQPPYVAVIFAKTYEDGSREWVGLTKGLFLRPNKSGQSKQGSVEFTGEEITAQFMDREVEDFDEEKSVLFARDKATENEIRDKLFEKIFDSEYPGESEEQGGVEG